MLARLFDGPAPQAGPESHADHLARLGPLGEARDHRSIVSSLEASGLLGRGGAGFPVGRKWRAVAERADGDAVVLVNGAEGEPLSAKDRTLMAARPHLVIDGAILAAEAVGAREIVVYVGATHVAARDAMIRALARRSAALPVPVRVVDAPHAYVAGEESAAVHYINAGDARPTTTPPRPYERGIRGRPTLVQNVESLAHAALIARFGDAWFRDAGHGPTRGTSLATVSWPTGNGVLELELGTPISEVAAIAGIERRDVGAVLAGGYFGGWLPVQEAWDLPLDPVAMRDAGSAFGCGIVAFHPASACGVAATARIMRYMAGESAAQCGPCVFGLRAISDAVGRLAAGSAAPDDLARVVGWCDQLPGRGACRHPDGAVGLLQTALRVFADEFALHQDEGRCSLASADRRAA